MATSRFNVTIQFKNQDTFLRLKSLSIIYNETIGATLQRLSNAEAKKVGLVVRAWERQSRRRVDIPRR